MITNENTKEDPKKDFFKAFLGRRTIIILVVVALCFLIINQFLAYTINMKQLTQPCNACIDIVAKQNKYASTCVNSCLKVPVKLYPQPNGELKDDLGNCYNPSAQLISCKNQINITLINN